jgi:hypothetical protein
MNPTPRQASLLAAQRRLLWHWHVAAVLAILIVIAAVGWVIGGSP